MTQEEIVAQVKKALEEVTELENLLISDVSPISSVPSCTDRRFYGEEALLQKLYPFAIEMRRFLHHEMGH